MMTLTFCLGFGNQKDFLNLFEKLWKKLLLNSKKSKSLKVLRSPFKLVQSPEIEIGIAWRSKTRSICLLYTSPSPRDLGKSRMPSSA